VHAMTMKVSSHVPLRHSWQSRLPAARRHSLLTLYRTFRNSSVAYLGERATGGSFLGEAIEPEESSHSRPVSKSDLW
jgi:hypothetical protein